MTFNAELQALRLYWNSEKLRAWIFEHSPHPSLIHRPTYILEANIYALYMYMKWQQSKSGLSNRETISFSHILNFFFLLLIVLWAASERQKSSRCSHVVVYGTVREAINYSAKSKSFCCSLQSAACFSPSRSLESPLDACGRNILLRERKYLLRRALAHIFIRKLTESYKFCNYRNSRNLSDLESFKIETFSKL